MFLCELMLSLSPHKILPNYFIDKIAFTKNIVQ